MSLIQGIKLLDIVSMTDYQGQIFKGATIHTTGLLNDHIQIHYHADSDTCHIILRRDFYVADGPEPFEDKSYGHSHVVQVTHQKIRGWKQPEALHEDVPKPLAYELAQQAAKTKRVVLLGDNTIEGKVVLWHPDGWEPDIEPYVPTPDPPAKDHNRMRNIRPSINTIGESIDKFFGER